MGTQHDHAPASQDTQKVALNKRLDDIGWGLFLIMIGCIWLVPKEWVPQGTWLLGAGLLLLAINAVRYSNGIAMNGFTAVLGVLALAAGVGDLFGYRSLPSVLSSSERASFSKPLVARRLDSWMQQSGLRSRV